MRAIRAEARRLRFRRFEQKLLQKIGKRPIRYGCRPDGINILRCQQAPPPSSHVYAQKQKPCLSASDMDGFPAGYPYMRLFTDAGYRIRFRYSIGPLPRGGRFCSYPFRDLAPFTGFPPCAPTPVFLPARSRILHKSVDYMLVLWHDDIGSRMKWLCWCRSVFAMELEVLSGYANLVQMP